MISLYAKNQLKITKFAYLLLLGSTLYLNTMSAFAAQKAPGDLQYQREGGDAEKLKSFPPSIFQHWIHRIRFRCDACHDSLFEMKQGGTTITHDLMKKGKVCSTCHNGKMAFDAGFENCHRCHVTEEK